MTHSHMCMFLDYMRLVICVPWLTLICVTWLTGMCAMTHSDMCDMTHSVCAPWLTLICVPWLTLICVTWRARMCVTTHAHVCAMTHSDACDMNRFIFIRMVISDCLDWLPFHTFDRSLFDIWLIYFWYMCCLSEIPGVFCRVLGFIQVIRVIDVCAYISARPCESCTIFKCPPRRNAFSKLVHRQYKSLIRVIDVCACIYVYMYIYYTYIYVYMYICIYIYIYMYIRRLLPESGFYSKDFCCIHVRIQIYIYILYIYIYIYIYIFLYIFVYIYIYIY